MCLWWAFSWLTDPLRRLLIKSNDFKYCTKQFALQDFPHWLQQPALNMLPEAWLCYTWRDVCERVRVCLWERRWEREMEKRRWERPDLKRQIRASMKSIRGEPCTDFISWQTCAAKGMQTDIDVGDWLISSFLKKCTHRVAMRFVLGLFARSVRSVLNTSQSVTFFLEKQTRFSFNR